jgi:NADH-quinone oxidoreductase subunit M
MSLSSVLTFLVFSPLLGVLILGFMPKTQGKALKAVGFIFTLPSLVLALALFSSACWKKFICFFRFKTLDSIWRL